MKKIAIVLMALLCLGALSAQDIKLSAGAGVGMSGNSTTIENTGFSATTAATTFILMVSLTLPTVWPQLVWPAR